MARIKLTMVNRFVKQLVAVVCITLLGCIYIQQSHFHPQQLQHLNDAVNNQCKPHSEIVFVKAHKCASSTLQNIFMRYGYFNDKIFVLPPKGNYLGHPQPFNHRMVPDPSSFNGKYSILTHHTRLDYEEMRGLIPNAIFLTIIRDPVHLFESMYQYYKLYRTWGFNFSDFSNTSFRINTNELTQMRFAKRIGVNQMMFDMGFEPEYFYDDYKIDQYIRKLDSIFSLVMVSERMEESLILLKNLLCWDYEDVVVFKMNARNESYKHKVDEQSESLIRELNRADQRLYEHFSAKFDQAVEKFGKQRMQAEVNRLRAKINFYYQYCVGDQVTRNNSQIVRFVNLKQHSPLCKFLTSSELSLTSTIRTEQLKRHPGSVFEMKNATNDVVVIANCGSSGGGGQHL